MMADYIKREAALHLVESALAWGWSLNQLHEEIERLPAEGVGLEAALTQARAELAAIRRYQIAGCAAGLRGPVPECPRCGSHVVEWDAETDACKCGDCGWNSEGGVSDGRGHDEVREVRGDLPSEARERGALPGLLQEERAEEVEEEAPEPQGGGIHR